MYTDAQLIAKGFDIAAGLVRGRVPASVSDEEYAQLPEPVLCQYEGLSVDGRHSALWVTQSEIESDGAPVQVQA